MNAHKPGDESRPIPGFLPVQDINTILKLLIQINMRIGELERKIDRLIEEVKELRRRLRGTEGHG